MTRVVERYTADALSVPDVGARVMRPALGDVAVHWHDFYELCLVVSGSAAHIVNGERRALVPGNAFVLSPADFHEIRVDGEEPLVCFNTVVESRAFEAQLDQIGDADGSALPWFAPDLSTAAADFERLHEEQEHPRAGSRAAGQALLTTILVALWRAAADAQAPLSTSRTRRDVDPMQRAVRYVDRHFREPLTLADAARQAHLSPNYFSERFREHTGEPFQHYVQSRRLRFARALLTSTSLGVADVCHAAGFNTVSHFGRAYRARYGRSPSADRGPVEPPTPADGAATAAASPHHGDVSLSQQRAQS